MRLQRTLADACLFLRMRCWGIGKARRDCVSTKECLYFLEEEEEEEGEGEGEEEGEWCVQ